MTEVKVRNENDISEDIFTNELSSIYQSFYFRLESSKHEIIREFMTKMWNKLVQKVMNLAKWSFSRTILNMTKNLVD